MYENDNDFHLTVEETKELVDELTISILTNENTLFSRNEIKTIANEIETYLLSNYTT